MKHLTIISCLLMTIALCMSCGAKDPNTNKQGKDVLQSLEMDRPVNSNELAYTDTLYVPIYSHIYFNPNNQQNLLGATLSIRNTSFNHSLIISVIDYYNTQGNLVRQYLDKPIELSPMASVDYVVDTDDTTGGSGANFIVVLGSKSQRVKPIVQAVMVGSAGDEGIAFSVDAISIAQ